MSYKYLTGRLIETQRSMIGEPAIRIARSVEGIQVTDDGAVTSLDGDGYDVVAELSERYTEILGNAAERRLLAAADEFEADLVLPPALGGPDEKPANRDDRTADDPAVAGPGAGEPSLGVVSDGGTVAVPPESGAEPGDPTDAITRADDGAGSETAPAGGEAGVSVPEPLTVDYTVASSIGTGDAAEADLGSVYLLPADGSEWQEPVSIEAAVVDAITAATELTGDDVETPLESIDAERLFATLTDEGGETVSFGVAGVTVTFHRSGSVAVH